jgi:alkylhydroperoxidase family enzyme
MEVFMIVVDVESTQPQPAGASCFGGAADRCTLGRDHLAHAAKRVSCRIRPLLPSERTMPAVPYISDNDIEQQAAPADLVAAIRARRAGGNLLNLDRMLLHSAPLARGWNTYLGAIRKDLAITPLLRELAICAVARYNKADYEWLQHAPELLSAGGSQAQLDALHDIATAPTNRAAFSTIERLVIQLTQEMTQSITVNTATMKQLHEHLSAREIVEIVGVIAAYNMVSRFLVALEIEPE